MAERNPLRRRTQHRRITAQQAAELFSHLLDDSSGSSDHFDSDEDGEWEVCTRLLHLS